MYGDNMAGKPGTSRRLTARMPTWVLVLIFLGLVFVFMLILALAVLNRGATLPAIGAATATSAFPVNATSLQLSPAEGNAGTPLTLIGRGWRPGDTVFIGLDDPSDNQPPAVDNTAILVAATVSDTGDFTASFIYPGSLPWASLSRVLIVVQSRLTGQTAATEFRLIAPQTLTPTPSPTPQFTETGAPCSDRAAFVSDVTVPSNSEFEPGTPFVKTWRVQNVGTCAWDTSYDLVFVGDNAMQGATVVALPGSVPPGSTLDLSIDLTAPPAPGTYRGVWGLRNGRGILFEVGENASDALTVEIVVGVKPTLVVSGWRGEYFDNPNLSGQPKLVRDDPDVRFVWGAFSPATGIPIDNFSARWTRSLSFNAGTYRFSVVSDDGVRVWLDGELIVDQWRDSAALTHTADRVLSAGAHDLRIEYYDHTGAARIELSWQQLDNYPDWRAEYFTNANLSGAPQIVRNDTTIDFTWGRGAADSHLPVDEFSARWSRTLYFEGGAYRFRALVDDGVRLYVDSVLVIDQWRDGSLRDTSVDLNLAAGNHGLRVEYYERTGDALIRLSWEKLGDTFPDWRGEYYANVDLSGSLALVRNDASIDFDWGQTAPVQGMPVDNFSARWTRTATFEAGTYRFTARVDDGARLWVDNNLIVDEWRDGSPREVSGDIDLASGAHNLRVEYYDRVGNASIRVSWQKITRLPGQEWAAEFWNNPDLSGAPVYVRSDSAVDFDWGQAAPNPQVHSDHFSARWTRAVTFDPGAYRLSAQSDDGVRVLIDGVRVIDVWSVGGGTDVHTIDVPLQGAHQIIVEYFDETGRAQVKVTWERVGDLP
jgi:hypothetical protein